ASAAASHCPRTQVHAGVAAVSAGLDNAAVAADPPSLTTLLAAALGHPLTLVRCPLYPQKQTSVRPISTSPLCQKWTCCKALTNEQSEPEKRPCSKSS